MVWGLQQGMMGAAQESLTPSMTALGPNRYLKEKDFFTMVIVALVVHLAVVAIATLLPGQKVTDIPVRALSFKIGGHDKIAAYGLTTGIGTTTLARATPPAPELGEPASQWQAPPVATAPKPNPVVPVKPPKIVSIPREERSVPVENQSTLPPLVETSAPEVETPPPAPEIEQSLPDASLLLAQTPAIASTPQRFIREAGGAPPAGEMATNSNMGQGIQTGAVGGQGTETTMTPATALSVRERYEQQISFWIQQHKIYPAAAAGAEGKVVMRMRIDRTGYVRYYALEQSSGNAALDAAAIDMVRRANPVPAVPDNYPAGNLIEFLIPIMFKKP
jgi:protein TonB